MWKYVNPGYGELFHAMRTGTTHSTNIDYTTTGVYITENGNTEGTRIICNATKEIWIKCNVYFKGTYQKLRLYVDGHRQCGATVQTNYNDNGGMFYLFNKGNQVEGIEHCKSIYHRLTNIVMHVKSEQNNGVIELFVDDDPVLTFSGNVNAGNAISNIEISGVIDVFVSNIIVADYDISNENIAVCDLTDLTGTWDGITDGLAKATDVNQTLSQKINVETLKSNMSIHSANPTVTGITIAASGIRYDVEKVNALKASVKSGNSEIFACTRAIEANNTLSPTTYIKNISTDDLANMTLNLTSVKQ